jgi:hypothetical protein
VPNFAQQFPCLLFLPVIIFTALAVAVGFIHLAILLSARLKSRRWVLRQLRLQLNVSPPSLRTVPAARPSPGAI